MNEHNLFYYPYASFTNKQLPLLKVAALYFDKLYILDPDKASSNIIGLEDLASAVAMLDDAGILERIAPEEILAQFEQDIAKAILADMDDVEFMELCEKSGKAERWTLALAKVPESIRNNPQHPAYTNLKPQDRAMQRLMGELPRNIDNTALRCREVYAETTHHLHYDEQFVYDEHRLSGSHEIEYRYADYPLPLGQSIMMNHALFASLLHAKATPITDDPFHNQVLTHKMKTAVSHPKIQAAINGRAQQRQQKAKLLAASALMDKQLNLPILNPEIPLAEVLEYREKNQDVLQKTREKLGWMAQRIESEPWTKDFVKELETKTIPDLYDELQEAKKARDAWFKDQRRRNILKVVGIASGAATAVLAIFTAPITPMALAVAWVGLVGGTAVPGAEWLLDWKEGKESIQENGLHYLLTLQDE